MRRFYLPVLGAGLVILVVVTFPREKLGLGLGKELIKINLGGTDLKVETARTAKELEQGLSARREIGSGGMLFEINPRRSISFWMKDMLMPLDIVWIDKRHIVGIDHNVPPPDRQAVEPLLTTYPSPQAVEYVLELPAGRSKELGLEVGDRLELSI